MLKCMVTTTYIWSEVGRWSDGENVYMTIYSRCCNCVNVLGECNCNCACQGGRPPEGLCTEVQGGQERCWGARSQVEDFTLFRMTISSIYGQNLAPFS